jgi:murein DD-endopeptidase MepM/ murein hydrolase activator NlpD
VQIYSKLLILHAEIKKLMAKTKYIFNEEQQTYVPIKRKAGQHIIRVVLFVSTALALATLIFVLSFTLFTSPREKILERELAQYKLQFEIMNGRLDQMQKLLDELADKDDNIYRVIFEAEPIPDAIRKAGFGGADRYAKLKGYSNSELLINTAKKLDKIASEIYVQSKSYEEVYRLAREKEKMLRSIPAIQPVKINDIKRISSYFGYRIDPIYKVRKFHWGIDFSAPSGTPVFVTGDGVVEKVRHSRRGYGNTILVNNGYGYKTFYAHLDKILVKKGQKVKRGEEIGTVGNTGKSTAPHLHYEIIKNNMKVNPIYYFFNDLSAAEFEQMLELSKIPNQSLD